MITTMTIKNEAELMNTLCQLSQKHGGAWVFTVKPFSHIVKFERFQNPSSIPEHFISLTQNTMAHKGQIRGFTKAAIKREQNRGLGSAR